jgi:hypothetical protein
MKMPALNTVPLPRPAGRDAAEILRQALVGLVVFIWLALGALVWSATLLAILALFALGLPTSLWRRMRGRQP